MNVFEYHQPHTVDEALAMLKETETNNLIIAGGTDVMIMMNEGKLTPDHVINVKSIKDLSEIRISDQTVSIGAGATFTAVAQCPFIQEKVQVLYKACVSVGSPQIRNLGTVGGNVINGSVAGDSVTAFLALQAVLVLKSTTGERRISLREYYDGGAETAIRSDELLTAIEFYKPAKNFASGFFKVGKRNALAIVDIGAAVTLEVDEAMKCRKATVIGGALARFPLQITSAQSFLEGRTISDETFEMTYELLHDAVYESIKDRPNEVYYKKEAVKGAFGYVYEDIIKQLSRKGMEA